MLMVMVFRTCRLFTGNAVPAHFPRSSRADNVYYLFRYSEPGLARDPWEKDKITQVDWFIGLSHTKIASLSLHLRSTIRSWGSQNRG
jgi:hypothetical protein